MSKSRSYRDILRSSSIIGGASVVNILVGLLRMKAVAVLLGPVGVGLIGLMQSVIATVSTASSLGFGNVGTRQIAEAVSTEDSEAVAAARRALFWGTMVLSVIGAGVFWRLRRWIAEVVFNDPGLSTAVGWLAVGIALTVASGSQRALLNGMRRIGDIARVSIYSALFATVVGVAVLWVWGESAIPFFVLATPLATFLLGHLFVSRLPQAPSRESGLTQLVPQWITLVRLGSAFMIAGLMVTAGQLVVRTMVQNELGTQALGYFQASWVISMTYIGFVLQAMGTDYYPRLTAVIKNHSDANKLVNEQSEIALLLAGPVFVAMLGLAPWIIELLYSDQFAEAVHVLRWQILGDILKVVSWPLGFIILAAGDGRAFMFTESFGISVFALLTWVGLPLIGLEAAGIAFVIMYVVYLPTVFFLARRRTGFAWHRDVYLQFVLVAATAVTVFIAALWSQLLGAGVGVLAATVLGLHGIARIGKMTNVGGRLGRVSELSQRMLARFGGWRD